MVFRRDQLEEGSWQAAQKERPAEVAGSAEGWVATEPRPAGSRELAAQAWEAEAGLQWLSVSACGLPVSSARCATQVVRVQRPRWREVVAAG